MVELGSDGDNLLEVVEHEQRRVVGEVLDQDIEWRPCALDHCSDRRDDPGQHQLRNVDRGERHEHGPRRRRSLLQRFGHGDRQPRLADAARTGQRHEPDRR